MNIFFYYIHTHIIRKAVLHQSCLQRGAKTKLIPIPTHNPAKYQAGSADLKI